MITDEIDAAVLKFHVATNKPAQKIYLGKNEYRDLIRYSNRVCTIAFKKNQFTEILEYCGAKVYSVDQETHIGVGI